MPTVHRLACIRVFDIAKQVPVWWLFDHEKILRGRVNESRQALLTRWKGTYPDAYITLQFHGAYPTPRVNPVIADQREEWKQLDQKRDASQPTILSFQKGAAANA